MCRILCFIRKVEVIIYYSLATALWRTSMFIGADLLRAAWKLPDKHSRN